MYVSYRALRRSSITIEFQCFGIMETAMESANSNNAPPCIEVVEACGEWFVRIVVDDEELTRSFDLESLALAFAEGQRRRLGLAEFTRL